MNHTVITALRILFGIFCIAFGIDKFVEFLPKCSLLNHLPVWTMWGTGVLEIGLGLCMILDKYTMIALQIAAVVMFTGVVLHTLIGTYDFSGALIGTVVAMILIFLSRGKSADLTKS
jgi:hypothetical protein